MVDLIDGTWLKELHFDVLCGLLGLDIWSKDAIPKRIVKIVDIVGRRAQDC